MAGDLLLYYNILETSLPYDTDVDMSWDGGTLPGYDKAPPLPEQEVLHFPEAITGLVGSTASLPTINNVPMSAALVAQNDNYHFRWESWSGSTPDLLGTEIIFTVYGPTDFGVAPGFDVVGDNPFFTKFAQIVCKSCVPTPDSRASGLTSMPNTQPQGEDPNSQSRTSPITKPTTRPSHSATRKFRPDWSASPYRR